MLRNLRPDRCNHFVWRKQPRLGDPHWAPLVAGLWAQLMAPPLVVKYMAAKDRPAAFDRDQPGRLSPDGQARHTIRSYNVALEPRSIDAPQCGHVCPSWPLRDVQTVKVTTA